MEDLEFYEFVVIGGGIAAVSCAEMVATQCPGSILVVSGSPVVKCASNIRRMGKVMESFDVEEQSISTAFNEYPNITCKYNKVLRIDHQDSVIDLESGSRIRFKRLCVATGGTPKLVTHHPLVIGIRDTETVAALEKRLFHCSRVIVIGNGGIATELVYELKNVDVIWAIKHNNISSTFLDAGAGQFLLSTLDNRKESSAVIKRHKYVVESEGHLNDTPGSALGPDWALKYKCSGALNKKESNLHIEKLCELKEILSPQQFGDKHLKQSELSSEFVDKDCWPVYVLLTNGSIFGADLIVSATGVHPNTSLFDKEQYSFGADGGVVVDSEMRTCHGNVYAAGDVCTAGWEWAPHWIQMRLWTQGRLFGSYCGLCMAAHSRNEDQELDICFELFTHVTQFFGFKVVLLGKFNGQGLCNPETLVRVDKDREYVKVIIENGRVQGAVLVGDTDLDETLENLILNETDVSQIKDDLLNPSVDIEDYFD